MSRMVSQLRELIQSNLHQREHKSIPYGKYKDNSRLITKVCDFVDLFANVNGKIVQESETMKITNIFRDVTARLTQIERLLKEIRVISIKTYQIHSLSQRSNNNESQSNTLKKKMQDASYHTMWSFYFGLGEYERSISDTPPLDPTRLHSDRMMPIIHPEDNEKVDELLREIDTLEEWCDISHEPVSCGRRRRCSCSGLCFRPIFGSTKQMGLILAKTFEGHQITLPCE